MLTVNRDTKIFLPKEYHFINNVCSHLYDQLTEVFVEEDYSNMSSTTIDFETESSLNAATEQSNGHPFDILAKANRNQDLEIVVTKHVFMSILSDMVNFIYESIRIAQKGKMSVAYALLRKPFTDQLCILEQILVNRTDFINRFYHNGDPMSYDPSSKNIDKRKIIEDSVSKLGLVFFDHNIIYELRYDKSAEYSINAFSNHALHIVTRDANYKTEKQGLNFTFPMEVEEIKEYLDHYYQAVFMLLLYTTAVADNIIFNLIEKKLGVREFKHLKRIIAQLMISNDRSFSKNICSLLSKILVTKCNICKNTNKYTKRDFVNFFFYDEFTCKKCFNPVFISDESIKHLSDIIDISIAKTKK